MSASNVRSCTPDDLPALKRIIDAVGLFPAELLDEMISFEGPPGDRDEPREFWLVHDGDGGGVASPAGVAYCAPERMTEGTWNALLLAVHPDRQGAGLGAALMRRTEAILAARGERLLLVETSGTDAFEATRGFYARLGYEREAVIRDYYGTGDDKVVFRKAL